MRWLKRLLIGVAALVVAGIAGFFVFAPGIAERRMNRISPSTLPPVPPPVRAFHQTLTVVDLHADSLLWNRDLLSQSDYGHVDIPRLIQGGVALQAFTLVTASSGGQNIHSNTGEKDDIRLLSIGQLWPVRTWTNRLERALYQAQKLDELARRSNGAFTLIRSRADLQTYLKRREIERGITAGFLGVEGAHALEGDVAKVDRLFDAGIRMMAPTHFFDNDIAGSAHGVKKGGLTEKGREMIRRMEAKKMLVDVAHASPATIDDVLALATRPVIVSHTGVKGTCDNPRNLSDDQLRGIARTGGLVGIAYFHTATCGDDVQAIARAIRHAADVAGVDHVALGSDYDGAVTVPFDTRHLDQVTSALLSAGLSQEQIRKIMGDNAVRVLLAALP